MVSKKEKKRDMPVVVYAAQTQAYVGLALGIKMDPDNIKKYVHNFAY